MVVCAKINFWCPRQGSVLLVTFRLLLYFYYQLFMLALRQYVICNTLIFNMMYGNAARRAGTPGDDREMRGGFSPDHGRPVAAWLYVLRQVRPYSLVCVVLYSLRKTPQSSATHAFVGVDRAQLYCLLSILLHCTFSLTLYCVYMFCCVSW